MGGNITFGERSMLIQLAQSLPKYFDMSSNYYAYIYNSINQPDQSEQWRRMIDETMISGNMYAKEVAGKAANIGSQLYNKLGNFVNVQKATSIDVKYLQKQLAGSSQTGQNTLLHMMAPQGSGD